MVARSVAERVLRAPPNAPKGVRLAATCFSYIIHYKNNPFGRVRKERGCKVEMKRQ